MMDVVGAGGRSGDEAGLVGAVAAGAVAAAVVSAAMAAAVVLAAVAVVSTAVAEDQGQPLVGLLLGSGGEDGSSFGYYLASFLASVYLLVS